MTKLTDAERLLRTVQESAWQAQVEETIAWAGFELIYHANLSLRDRRGWPDLVAIRREDPGWTLIVAELKRETTKPTPEQAAWLTAWRSIADTVNALSQTVRIIVGVWRPSDAERVTELVRR